MLAFVLAHVTSWWKDGLWTSRCYHIHFLSGLEERGSGCDGTSILPLLSHWLALSLGNSSFRGAGKWRFLLSLPLLERRIWKKRFGNEHPISQIIVFAPSVNWKSPFPTSPQWSEMIGPMVFPVFHYYAPSLISQSIHPICSEIKYPLCRLLLDKANNHNDIDLSINHHS